MNNYQLRFHKDIRDNYDMWVKQKTLDIVSILVGKSGMDHAFSKVGPSLDWALLPPEVDKRIYSKYDGCVIHLHECLFSMIGFYLPFDKFEVGVLSHIVIAPSQLHPVIWAYIKVFQYCVSSLTLFFHPFKSQRCFTDLSWSQCLIYLMQSTKRLEVYLEIVKNFKD